MTLEDLEAASNELSRDIIGYASGIAKLPPKKRIKAYKVLGQMAEKKTEIDQEIWCRKHPE